MNKSNKVTLGEVAKMKKLKKKGSKKTSLDQLNKPWERPGLLKDIEGLKATDIELFQTIKADLDMKHKDIAKPLGISGGAISVWLTAKNTGGVPEGRIEEVRNIFIAEYCKLNRMPVVPKPVDVKDMGRGRKSAHSELIEFILEEDKISRTALKAQMEGNLEPVVKELQRLLDTIQERTSEYSERLEMSGYSS